jgi:hypothetical protein
MSDLDKDFVKVAEQINAKLQEAAAALREASRLSDEVGLPALIATQWTMESIYDRKSPLSLEEKDQKAEELREKLELIKVRDFEHAMGECGWSASSSYC